MKNKNTLIEMYNLKNIESDIIESTKEFAESHHIHYDYMTENMIVNGMREMLISSLFNLSDDELLNLKNSITSIDFDKASPDKDFMRHLTNKSLKRALKSLSEDNDNSNGKIVYSTKDKEDNPDKIIVSFEDENYTPIEEYELPYSDDMREQALKLVKTDKWVYINYYNPYTNKQIL